MTQDPSPTASILSDGPQSPAAHAQQTTCCIVGAGPAGAMLALLLARQGVPVVLLEAHLDFEREFRGDTLHASVMEILDELGLAEPLLQLRHAKVSQFVLPTRKGSITIHPFARLKTKFRYITVIAQSRFLEFITEEARRYPHFRLVMGAHVDALLEEDGLVRGVRYHRQDASYEVRAMLTVGTDGRFSQVRKLAGFRPIKTASPIDALWFRLSRRPTDPDEALMARVGKGLFVVCIDRFDYWQVGCIIPKGGYQQFRAAGLPQFRQSLATVVPEWADRVAELATWQQLAVLSVEASRLKRWYRPGLLLIGDAAHVMSPVGGLGINYAIQDAVVAVNVLGSKLLDGTPLTNRDLAAVQRRREWPTRFIQLLQAQAQRAVFARVVATDRQRVFTVPKVVLPLLKMPRLLAPAGRLLGFGLFPPHVQTHVS